MPTDSEPTSGAASTAASASEMIMPTGSSTSSSMGSPVSNATTGSSMLSSGTSASMQKSSGSSRNLLIIGAILLFLCICCVIPLICLATGSLSSVTDSINRAADRQVINNITVPENNTPGATTPGTTPPAGGSTLPTGGTDIGTSKTVDDWTVTLGSATKSGSSYILDLSVRNNSGESQTFSTILQTTLKSSSNSDYSQDFFFDRGGKAQLDGSVAARAVKQGVMAFRVDDNPSDLTLVVSGGLLSDSKVEFKIK